MRNRLRIIPLVAAGLLAACVPLAAHHGTAVYDTSKTITVKGTVTEYVWANPHVYAKVDDKDDSGNTTHWILEAQNPVSQTEVGWSKNTFKPGDEVEIEVKAAKNGKAVGIINNASRIIINAKQFKP
jgi:Family of unknown function (DUF6152)